MGLTSDRKFKLNSGTEIPAIGLGTVDGDAAGDKVVTSAVLHAIKIGYRHFDTAALYQTERAVGEAIAEAIKSGLVTREELFVTSKVWVDHCVPELVPVAFHTSLSNLGLEYLDLYLIHFPVSIKKGSDWLHLKEEDYYPFDCKGVWQELEKLKEQGLVKAIGVSNFSIKRLQDLLAVAKIPPAVNQVELHPVWQSGKLLEYCARKGDPCDSIFTSWSPWTSLCWPEQYGFGGSHSQGDSGETWKTPAQISLRWVLEQGASLVPKSYNQSRLALNFDIFDWSLTAEDHEKIKAVPQHKLLPQAQFFNGQYKTFEELWDDNE